MIDTVALTVTASESRSQGKARWINPWTDAPVTQRTVRPGLVWCGHRTSVRAHGRTFAQIYRTVSAELACITRADPRFSPPPPPPRCARRLRAAAVGPRLTAYTRVNFTLLIRPRARLASERLHVLLGHLLQPSWCQVSELKGTKRYPDQGQRAEAKMAPHSPDLAILALGERHAQPSPPSGSTIVAVHGLDLHRPQLGSVRESEACTELGQHVCAHVPLAGLDEAVVRSLDGRRRQLERARQRAERR